MLLLLYIACRCLQIDFYIRCNSALYLCTGRNFRFPTFDEETEKAENSQDYRYRKFAATFIG